MTAPSARGARSGRRVPPRSGRGRSASLRVERVNSRGWRKLARAPDLFDDPVERTAVQAYLRDRRNVFFLARVQGLPVGFLRGSELLQPHTARPQMFLYEVGVAPRFRRRGVGRALVVALLEYCRAHRFEEVFVFTDPANRAAVRLYRSTGARTETPRDRMFVWKSGARRPRGAVAPN